MPRISDNGIVSLGHVKRACDSNAFRGSIAEVLVYDTSLSDTQIEQVERYLGIKYWGKAFEKTERHHQQHSKPIIRKEQQEEADPPKHQTEHRKERKSPGEKEPQVQAKDKVTKFDPNDVFTWKPPPSALASDTLAWSDEVEARYQAIKQFQYGGDVLKKFIRGKKLELNVLRDQMFGYLLE